MPFGHPYWHSLWSASGRPPPLVSFGLLGDASIPLDGGNPRFCVKFGQTIERAEYIWHLYNIFKDPVGRLCRNTPARAKPA